MNKLLLIFLLVISATVYATHNRAGEITYTHVSGLTYEITVTTYTRDQSPADRPELPISWGDNSPVDSIDRISKVFLGNDINKNIYVGRHTYPGPSPTPYTISIEDPNRNENIVNIPNSVNIVFYLETQLYINPFQGINNSPVLLNPPIDNACVNQIYIHNPGAVDPDGDSLYYSIDRSRAQGGTLIPGYTLPNASNFLTINSANGDLIWNTPTMAGEFNIAILIEEFRNGQRIGAILRDMQITVYPNCPPPPNITTVSDTCIIAGDFLGFNIFATGSSAVTLTSTGIPYSLPNAANFQQVTAPSTSTTGTFTWSTNCSNVRKTPYYVSFKATDSHTANLVDYQTTTIRVIGPKIQNLTTTVQPNSIKLDWSPTCSNAIGYHVYRRRGNSTWNPSTCETGIPPIAGYQYIGQTSSVNDTTYTDNNQGQGLIPGEDYCYRVYAIYPDGAKSIASDEACGQLEKNVPIITHVSVNSTDVSTGDIYVEWSKPTDHNTTIYPGPYRYLIYRGVQSTSNMVLIDSTATINDTTYTDINLNTKDFQYYYRVDIYNLTNGTRELMGQSTVASSIYLTLVPSDNQLTLVWNENVPWTNTQHVIYRQNTTTLLFDSLDITSNATYTDTGLSNLTTYCYKVKSIGGYSSPDIVFPIINYSQEICGQPIDNVKPCPPILTINADCDLQQNELNWQTSFGSCADDVLSFNLYKKDSLDGDYVLIATINDNNISNYLHSNLFSIAGCYVITGIDSVGNESAFSDSVCVDNCPNYDLPNIFTPGGDGMNDFFQAFPFKYIGSIDLEIFNRWGQVIYKATEPDFKWDGTHKDNGADVPDGTYYYLCKVNELTLEGTKPRIIKGFVTLLRNKGVSKP